MFEFIEGKELELKNLISIRKSVKQRDAQEYITGNIEKFKKHMIESEYFLTATHGVSYSGIDTLLDYELLLPIKAKVDKTEDIDFKEKIKIINALYSKFKVNSENAGLLNTAATKYIEKNNLKPITSTYIVYSPESKGVSLEMYIGMNPNIL